MFAGSLKGVKPTETGKQQFFDDQSRGIKPTDPDSYYQVLSYGKIQFDLLCREYYLLYKSGEWWGFHQLWKDWEGERWLLPYLLKWYKKETGRSLPIWITKEEKKKPFTIWEKFKNKCIKFWNRLIFQN